jgi:hypothetical protein
MSLTPGNPYPPAGDPYTQSGAPVPPAGYAPSAPAPGRNGLAIAGFIFAFLFAPIGFILSLIGLIQAGARHQKGKVLASLGLVISLLIMGGVTAVFFTVGKNVLTVADPGCVAGKTVIMSAANLPNDPAALKTQLQTMVTGLNAAAAASQHDNVRTALKALSDDYAQLGKAIDSGNQPPADLETKVTDHANAIDALCTLGAAK